MFAEPPAQAIVSLQESRYGYSIVDIGIEPADLANFDQIQIEKNLFYNTSGVPSADDLTDFLMRLGPNEQETMRRVSLRIADIAEQILLTSGRETLLVTVSSFIPTPLYDLPRWHMDGQYYKPAIKGELQYRFVLALVGASTLFYPLPSDFTELRKNVWIQMTNRKLMAEMFEYEKALSPPRGTAAFLIGGDRRSAALHSEPPIHTPRLFLSLIPCSEQDLTRLNGITL